VRARTAEGERAVVVAFYMLEQVEDAVGLLGFETIGLVVPFLVHFRVVAEDFQGYLHSFCDGYLTNKLSFG
jgi:hypothetical protein